MGNFCLILDSLSLPTLQVLVILILANFFEAKTSWPSSEAKRVIPSREDGSPRFESLVAQMATGEGKSIVIAMLAILLVKHYSRKVSERYGSVKGKG